MSVEAAKFQQIDPERVSISNLLIANELNFEMGEGSQAMTASAFQLVNYLPSRAMTLVLRASGKEFQLMIPALDAEQLLAVAFESVDLASLPNFLLHAAIERIIVMYRTSLNKTFGCNVELLSVTLDDANLDSDLTGEVTVLKAKLAFSALAFDAYFLVSPDHCVPFLRQYLSKRKRKAPNFGLKIQFSFGHLTLPLFEFNDLAIGDVLFFDVCYFAHHNRQCMMIENRPAWLVERQLNSFTVISPWSETMNQQAMVNGAETDSAFDTDEIQVNVVFQMPDQKMTFGEVQSLAPGYVFDLQAEPSKAVQVSVNGQAVGFGELVSVGGKLGVRLTSVHNG